MTIATKSLAGRCVAQLVKGFFKKLYTAAVDLFC